MRPPDPVTTGLERARAALQAEGIHVPSMSGKLLRPTVAWALVPPDRRAGLDASFWCGALAIQMVHEASLLHDDILDGAERRRGVGTTAAEAGVGQALVLGDLYLTGAYRAAAAAERPVFLAHFIESVERTVAGEVAQGRQVGSRSTPEAYECVIRGKAGALFGAAAVLAATPAGGAHAPTVPDAPGHARSLAASVAFGERLGAMYQRIDDLLDYCTSIDTGKPPLQDYAQGKWTWVLDLAEGVEDFTLAADEVVRRLFDPDGRGSAPAEQALAALGREREALLEQIEELSPGDSLVPALLDEWLDHTRQAVHRQRTDLQVRASTPAAIDEVRGFALELGGPERWRTYFGEHAKTFRLAARLFPEDAARTVAGVYAYCRFTDDLVDEPADGAGADRVRARLAAWRMLTEAAWDGEETGIPLLDGVIADAARSGVSRRYPMALLDGVAMDLERTRYQTWHDLERYTFGVAGAVGGWLTQAFGIHDAALLERAHDLGHAMQLTNIARDVGEDLARGRLYVPVRVLHEHGLSPGDLDGIAASGGPPPVSYTEVVEALLARADAYYGRAWPAIGALPSWYRRPVAAAAAAYRGIHDEIRRNDYDNLRRRAHTSTVRKILLAAGGIARAGRTPATRAAQLEEAVQ
jgi:15-cis-phytoene synthase